MLTDKRIEILGNEYISTIINDLLDLDIIGITGTLGKTSTTHILSEIFIRQAIKSGHVHPEWETCLSEVIVDGIVKGLHKKNNIAVLELPHGTSRLMSKVDLKCRCNY